MTEFTAKEIASIIRACKSSGVKEIEYNGLLLRFHPSEPQEKKLPPVENHQFIENVEPEPPVYDEDLEEIRKQNLMLEDPLAYEEEMSRDD